MVFLHRDFFDFSHAHSVVMLAKIIGAFAIRLAKKNWFEISDIFFDHPLLPNEKREKPLSSPVWAFCFSLFLSLWIGDISFTKPGKNHTKIEITHGTIVANF